MFGKWKTQDQEKLHDSFVDYLLRNPQCLNLSMDKILSRAKEVDMIDGNNGLVGRLDLQFLIWNGNFPELFVYEVKSSNSKSCLKKGKQQLHTARLWGQRYGLVPMMTGLIYPNRSDCRTVNQLEQSMQLEYII